MSGFGVVVIGRNEGERLTKCLQSLAGYTLVYVDSGSSDGSLEEAKKAGANVLELDLSIPFTAARARNEGFKLLLELAPLTQFVMFIDGDCEVVSGWVNHALRFLGESEDVVAVCGRRKERYPEASIYNRLCDIEWDTPVGYANSCGGDAIYRVKSLEAVGGFNPSFIAGEEPELCYRLREKGGKIYRLDCLMTMHDASMTRFSQWWKRAERSGYAYFLGFHAHGRASNEAFKRKEVISICGWSTMLLAFLVFSFVWLPSLFILLFVLAVQVFRIYRSLLKGKTSSSGLAAYAVFTVFAKFPQCLGVVKAYLKLLSGKQMTLVEYK